MTRAARAKVIHFRRSAAEVDPLSVEALLAGCAMRDPNALAHLFERLCDDVARFLGRLAYVDEEDVDDLVQDVFLAVYRNAASYQRKAGAKTWILAIAGNLARDRSRKAVRGRNARERLIDASPGAPKAIDRAVIERDLMLRVQRSVADLPHDLRVAFVMCDVEELPGVKVARALGVPRGTLYRRLHEARLRLRRAVEGKEP